MSRLELVLDSDILQQTKKCPPSVTEPSPVWTEETRQGSTRLWRTSIRFSLMSKVTADMCRK